MKQITKKQWKGLRESDRKLILRHAMPNMIEYYNTIDDTTSECNSIMWDVIKQHTKYNNEGRISVRNIYPGNIKVAI